MPEGLTVKTARTIILEGDAADAFCDLSILIKLEKLKFSNQYFEPWQLIRMRELLVQLTNAT